MRKNDYIAKVLGIGAVISFTALISVVSLQVFARFMLPKAPSWTEEASRFLFIYSVAFSAPLALKRGEYVKVDIVVSKMPKKLVEKLDGIIYGFLSLFFLLITYHGYTYASLGTIQTSPAMALPMVIPYSSIAFSAVFITIYSAKRAAGSLKKKKNDREEVVEEWS